MARISPARRARWIVAAIPLLGALTGCGAGQVAPTASGVSSVSGVNTEAADGSVLVRNLAVVYPGVTGYAAGAAAPVEVHLFNQTSEPVTVSITSPEPVQGRTAPAAISARSVTTAGAAAGPASVTIEPLGFAAFQAAESTALSATGLSDRLDPGEFLNLVFEFSNGAPALAVPAPVAIPMSPAPREPDDSARPDGGGAAHAAARG